jgi:hypothetical protein
MGHIPSISELHLEMLLRLQIEFGKLKVETLEDSKGRRRTTNRLKTMVYLAACKSNVITELSTQTQFVFTAKALCFSTNVKT